MLDLYRGLVSRLSSELTLGSRNRLAPVHLVPARRQSDYASDLLLDIALVPQFGYCDTCEGRINCLLRQPYELAGIVLVVLRQGDKKFGLDRRWLHLFSLDPVCSPPSF